jgi:hypothetical protein
LIFESKTSYTYPTRWSTLLLTVPTNVGLGSKF